MNLFDKIIQSQFNNFTGQAQPQVPSFDTPQAPRTTNYTQPNIPTATVKKTSPVVRNGGFAPGYEGTVDETQSGLFKVIQGGADLFTGIKKRLGETVQEDKTRFDTEMSQKRQQFISDMLAKGKKKEDIFSALDSLKAKGEFDFKPGISESIVGGVGNRMQTIENETTRLSQIQDPLARTTAGILPYAGQTVAGALEPITSALEPFVSPVVKAVIDKTGQTENIQELSQGWSEFEKTNPILAGNIEGLLNVSQLAPLPFAKPVGNAIKKGTVETGKAIVRGAEYVAPKVVEGVKKITPSLPKGSDISTRANRFIAGDEQKFVKEIKETPGEFATSRGMKEVGEKAIEKAQQNFERSKAEADTSFEAIQGKFSTKGSSNDIVGDLLKANKEKMDAQPRNKDATRVNELLAKYESGEGLSMTEINEAKRIHARNHKYSYEQRTSNEARNASDIQNDIRDWQFKTAKENGFTNADKVNMETKGWKMFADSLAKNMDRSGANNSIGITDWIVLSGGNPTNIALFLGKKVASSNIVKTGAIKLLSKQTKPSIIKGTKADIQQANFEKNVNRGISSDRNSVGGDSMVTPAGLIEAPTGQVTGAKNFRVNQPAEKPPIKNEGQVGVRPGSKSQAQIKEEVQLAKQATRQSELKLITDDIASATERARYGGTGNTRIETQLNGKMDAGKLTREEAIDIATEILQDVQKKGISSKYKYIDRPKLEEYINDLYSNKKMPTFDDLLNESKPIVTPPSNAKQQVIKPKSTTTNVFGETIDKPSNKKGGFIRNPFAKIEPKRLFAGENSAQPPKGKTGWFKGADGKMRFEIDDSGAKVNIGNEDITKLGKILTHDDLFKQYPELKNLDVELNKNIKGSGIYSNNLIRINTDTVGGLLAQKTKQWQQALSYKPTESDIKMLMSDGISKEKATEMFKNIQNKRVLKIEKEIEDIKSKGYIDDSDIKSTLLHEIQHYIQMKEGFARGSDPILENKIIAKEVQKKIDAVNDKMMKNKEGMDSMSNSEFEQMKIRHKELEAQRTELEDKMDRLRKYESEGFDQYNRSAGEVESRNVQSRMGLSAKERTIKKPESTEDVPRAKQIIRMDSKGPSMLKIPEIGKKSEIKPEIEKYLKTQNIYDKKQGEYGTILKKLSEEYSDGKGGISDEGRLLPKYKEAKKNFDYYFKLLQDFNGLESSKKASKEFNKLGIVERQKIRRQINETKGKINVNDNPIGLVSDSNKSIPVKNPLVDKSKGIPKK